jgi:MoxR-like ATPase
MAATSRKRAGELIRKVFEILLPQPGGLPAHQVLARLEQELPPTEFERSFYEKSPNVRRFENIIRFHTIGPVKAGWMIKDNGLWAITELGKKAYAEYQDPREFMQQADRLYQQWRREQPDSKSPELSDVTTDDVVAALAEIDKAGVPTTARSTFYDLIYAGKRYPPKYALALAHKGASEDELGRADSTDGEESQAFSVLRDLGFTVERKDFVKELLIRFLDQARLGTDLGVRGYPESYCGLDLSVSFGKGNVARIPWIAFLAPGEQVSRGIYPVLLLYKNQNQLMLAYGISETEGPEKTWQGVEGKSTIETLFRQQHGTKPDRYGASYVAAVYNVASELDFDQINADLDRLIAEYKHQLPEDQRPGQRNWIFQANPKLYDVDAALKSLKTIGWSVRQHGNDIKLGDRVFFWRSGKDAGILAVATITERRVSMTPRPEEEAFRKAPFEDALSVTCRIDEVLPEPLLALDLRTDPALAELSIFRWHQGTNFPVTAEQAEELLRMIRARGKEEPRQPFYTVDDFALESGFPPATIRQWMARLLRKKHVVFQGPPGTGKTFVAERLARTLTSGTTGFVNVVQFHPSFAYEDFMQGIRPEVVDGHLAFHLSPGLFLDFCRDAERRGPDAPCVLIIDELNRANLSRVFGELMYLLEYRDKSVPLATGREHFRVPSNVYLIGTMNTADRSIALVDHALRRRFSFIYLGPDYEVLMTYLDHHGLPAESLVGALRQVNEAIGERHYEVGISFFLMDGSNLRKTLEAIWTGEIEPYLEEYFFDQPTKVDALRWNTLRASVLADWAS